MKRSVVRKIRRLPDRPGVYLFKDARGRVLYIGKARRLRERVRSYTREAELDGKTRAMTEKAAEVEVIEAPSEVDALLMEARLIKDVRPKYNLRLKDDKSFNVIEITNFDDYPKVWIVRETDDVRGRRTGPFAAGAELREAVKVMQRVFRFATCTIEMRVDDSKRRHFRPCLLHAIGRCTAPCADRIPRDEYGADVASFDRFLRGEREPLLRELRKRMKEASTALEFERAAGIRDQIRSLRSLARRSKEFDYLVGDITPIDPKEGLEDLTRALRLGFAPRTVEGIDIAQLGGREAAGSVVTFIDGIPFKSGYRRYRIRSVDGVDDYAMVQEVVRRRFRRKKEEGVVPDVLLIDGGVGHLGAAAAELARVGAAPRLLVSLAKREETLFRWTDRAVEVPLLKSAAALRLMMYVRDEAHRFAQHYHHLLRRKAIREEE